MHLNHLSLNATTASVTMQPIHLSLTNIGCKCFLCTAKHFNLCSALHSSNLHCRYVSSMYGASEEEDAAKFDSQQVLLLHLAFLFRNFAAAATKPLCSFSFVHFQTCYNCNLFAAARICIVNFGLGGLFRCVWWHCHC